jgi:hypothetical protein
MAATKSKTNLAKKQFESRAKFKHTKQGNGTRSLPSHGRKLRRGQGK